MSLSKRIEVAEKAREEMKEVEEDYGEQSEASAMGFLILVVSIILGLGMIAGLLGFVMAYWLQYS